MARQKGNKSQLKADVEEELDKLLKQTIRKKSALKKISKLIKDKNEK